MSFIAQSYKALRSAPRPNICSRDMSSRSSATGVIGGLDMLTTRDHVSLRYLHGATMYAHEGKQLTSDTTGIGRAEEATES